MVPARMELRTTKPAAAKTSSIRLFSPSTSASKAVMPLARAIGTRCSSSSVPMPRPWCSSATAKATSARCGGRSALRDGDVAADADDPLGVALAQRGDEPDVAGEVQLREPA